MQLENLLLKSHHAAGHFLNPWGKDEQIPLFQAAAWMLNRLASGRDFTPIRFKPDTRITHDFNAPVNHYRITWLGHATCLIQLPEMNILTDPIFSNRASPLAFAGPKRLHSFPLHPDRLPPIDIVLISHNHYDHLDESTVRWIEKRHHPCFIVPLGVERHLHDWKIREFKSLDWWESSDISGATIHCLPAKHFSGRTPWDRNATLWASFLFASARAKIYFGGDTGYAPHFREIGKLFPGIDAALIPIGACKPRSIMRPIHLDSAEALQAFSDLKANKFIGIHWGTYDLSEETPQEILSDLRAAIAANAGTIPPERVPIIMPGQSTEG